ncbi:alpha/beta hydrolase [Silicimonas sp. MF1-12-2]|uniref:alpha/beta hydrolase n=1 Tax=Silicimonas sp. MF1-12-2 TaxID=3384793 RepID=UPI0039B606C1
MSAFNSVENARDVESLRHVFGYGEINFYGVSYGSELAQVVIREVPAVRSAILDAVVPISYDLLHEPARAQQMIGERYLLGCREDPRCNAAFPNLAERYLAMIDRLNAESVNLTIYPIEGERREIPVQLNGDLLEDVLFSALYGNVSSIVPLIVHQADQGDFALVASVLLPSQLGSSGTAEAMHLSVVCSERSKSSSQPDLSGVLPRLAEATRDDAAMQIAICEAWGIEQLPFDQVAPVRSEKPLLLISGAYDPFTPPVYGESLLAQFPAAHHVVFPRGTHGQVVTNMCANALVASFLDEPTSQVETSCIPASAPEVVTQDDVVFLGVLNRSIAQSGIMGLA